MYSLETTEISFLSVLECLLAAGGLRRYFNPPWYSGTMIPNTPYDPTVLRTAFEKAIVLHPSL
jgi:hypothetical protein